MKKRTAAIFGIMIFMVMSFFGTAFGIDSGQIRTAQQKLYDLEYDPGPADGVMGGKTVQALKHFQVDRSLPVTGRLDSTTLQALGMGAYRSIRRSGNPGNRVALVIGNSRYRSAPLKNPVNDAEDIAAVLERLNFTVINCLNATQEQMDKAVNEFGRRLRRANVGFFFFAGHGMQVNRANYLIPVGSKITSESDVKYRALNAGIVVGKMQDAGSKLNIVILDACRDNPFKRSFRSSSTGLTQMDAPVGTIIAFATSPGKKAGDGPGRNGVFTKNLLHFIDKPGLPVQEILNQAGLGVMQDTSRQQVPWISNTPIEKFYLASGDKPPSLPPQTHPVPRPSSGGLSKALRDALSASQKRSFTEPVTGMEFVWVKGGCYQMGDTFGDGNFDEKPVHRVCVDGFWLGKTEVTQGEWRKIMGSNPSHFKKGDNYPVEQVSWNDSQAFIKKLNNRSGKRFRLPYEAEWEYAAREGGKKVRFGTGKNTIGPDEANFNATAKYKKDYSRSGQYREKTVPVASFSPNSLGLYDMSGNLWEWCEDYYGKNYYSNSPQDNPHGPSEGSFRVRRGGSWYYNPGSVRAAYRYRRRPDYRDLDLGFRLALPSGQ